VSKETAPQEFPLPEARTTESLEATVIEKSLAQPAPPAKLTRFERGIALAQEHFEEITRGAPWIWSVPSCSGPGVHAVNLKTGECPCEDRTPEDETDKHVTAARYVKAKTGLCAGCGFRFRHRDLVEVQESLTYFEGDLLCPECWGGSDAVVL
jgi:hypothetical protein